MLLDHVFDKEFHSYYVPPPRLCEHGKGWVECGQHVGELPLSRKALCISDVIELNGLNNHDAIPPSVLERAAERGNEFDRWVQAYLQGDPTPDISENAWECVKGFLAFAANHDIEIAAPLQRSMVWEYGEGEQTCLLACTPDWPLLIDGVPTVVDGKTVHPLSGTAYNVKELAWRIQTQCQMEGLDEVNDDTFAETIPSTVELVAGEWSRAILHCHPKLTSNPRKRTENTEIGEGYRFIRFPQDDSGLLASAVHMAMIKIDAGVQGRKEINGKVYC